MLKCSSTISKFTTLMDCRRTSLRFPKTAREPFPNTRESCSYDYEECSDKIRARKCLGLNFFTRRMKMLSRPDGFMLYCKSSVDFFSSSDLPCPNMKVRLRLIWATPIFYMISHNPNVSFRFVHCFFVAVVMFLRLMIITKKKRKYMLAYTTMDFNDLETLVLTAIPARQNQLTRKSILSMLPVVRLLRQWLKLCIH